MKSQPYSLFLDEVDAAESLVGARWIKDNIPVFQRSNASGKFYRNYVTYAFWHDSRIPLIQNFVSCLHQNNQKFLATYGRQIEVNYVFLSYVENAEEEICTWHKDGYWWNGQFHLTILGHSNILVQDEGLEVAIKVKNGSVWYLNGTQYLHKISPCHQGERFELLAPCSFRQDSAARHFEAVTDTPERWIDPTHPSIIEEKKICLEYMKKSLATGKASNLLVAEWTDIKVDQES